MLTIARQGDGEDELDLGKHSRHLLLHMRRPELSLLCLSHCSITFKLSVLNMNLELVQSFDFYNVILSIASLKVGSFFSASNRLPSLDTFLLLFLWGRKIPFIKYFLIFSAEKFFCALCFVVNRYTAVYVVNQCTGLQGPYIRSNIPSALGLISPRKGS